MGPYTAGAYNLTLSRAQSRLQTRLPWATLCQSRLYPAVRDLGFSHGSMYYGSFGYPAYIIQTEAQIFVTTYVVYTHFTGSVVFS
jgi:hypothetical protein